MATDIITLAEAKVKGLKFYFTGVACKYGHIAQRVTSQAACSICLVEKDRRWKTANRELLRERQNIRNGTPSEYRNHRLALRAEWREKNKDKLLAESAKRRAEHPERIRESAKRLYWKDPAKQRSRSQKWRVENLDKRQKYLEDTGYQKAKEWRASHKDEVKAYLSRWQKENKDRVYASIHKRRALKKSSEGTHTASDITAILRAQNYCCPYCKANLKRVKRHIDHITPLSKGGTNDRTNIQVTCEPCNLQKGSKDPIVFAQSRGLLL